MPDNTFIDMKKFRERFLEDSLERLREAYFRGNLVIFVGAGVDKESNYPLWDEAMEPFIEKLYGNQLTDTEKNKLDKLKIPQYYYNTRGNKEYADLCKEIFCYNQPKPISELHKKIIDLSKVNIFITTNYTNLLEKEIRNRGYFCQVIAENNDLSNNISKYQVIKMHGDFDHNNFVLKEEDYLNYSENFKLIETYIKSLIATKVILFIGYSFSDPDLKNIFNWVKNILGKHFQRAYMLNDRDDFDYYRLKYLERQGINILYLKDDKKYKDIFKVLNFVKNDKYNETKEILNNIDSFSSLNYIPTSICNQILKKYNLIIENTVLTTLKTAFIVKNENNNHLESIIKYLKSNGKNHNDPLTKKLISLCYRTFCTGIATKGGIKPINEKNNDSLESDLYNLYIEFNYSELRNISKKVFDTDKEDYFYKSFIKAYASYLLYDYVKSWDILTNTLKISDFKYNDCLLFILQYDRYLIGNLPNLFTDNNNIIKEANDRIDLNELLDKIDNIPAQDYLQKIRTMQWQYTFFSDMSKLLKESEKQQKNYSVGKQYYVSLRFAVSDWFFNNFENRIMVIHNPVCKDIMYNYIIHMLKSVNVKDYPENESFFNASNIHAKYLTNFELFALIKYTNNPRELLHLLIEETKENSLPITEYGFDYLDRIINNFCSDLNLDLCLNFKNMIQEEFWKLVVLCCFIKINEKSRIKLLDVIIDWVHKNYLVLNLYNEIIYLFIDKNSLDNKNDNWFKNLKALSNNLLEIIKITNNYFDLHRFQSILSCCIKHLNTYENYEINEEIIEDLIESNSNMTLMELFKYSSQPSKNIIKDYFKQWQAIPDWEDFEIYNNIVLDGIIDSRKDIEDKIFENLDSLRNKYKNTTPNFYNNIIYMIVNLHLDNKLIRDEDYINYTKQSDDLFVVFLSDFDSFDYSKFDLDWLSNCHENLLSTFKNNSKVSSEIKKKYEEVVKEKPINHRLQQIYFEYFQK